MNVCPVCLSPLFLKLLDKKQILSSFQSKLHTHVRFFLWLSFFIAPFAQLHAQISSVKSGRWNDPTTWSSASVPGPSDVVMISSGTTVRLIGDMEAEKVMVSGTLVPPTVHDTFHLRTKLIMVHHGGRIIVGLPMNPYKGKGTFTLIGDDPQVNMHPSMGSKFLGIMGGGELQLHGKPKMSWTQLGGTAMPGANRLVLKEPVDWEVGDQIVIASTDYDMNHAEVRTITQLNLDKKILTLDQPLTYKHFGKLQTYTRQDDASLTWTLDERAEVGLLSHNVKIQGDEASEVAGFGGHTMAMPGAVANASYIELTRMGQKGKLGRYPWHWHRLGNGGSGMAVKGSSVHRTYNRAFTIHSTNNVRLENNVAYDNLGHAYFLEDGNEENNELIGNLGLVTRRPKRDDALLPSDLTLTRNASGPATFWITNPNNKVNYNHAAGSDGSGIWLSPHQNINSESYVPGLNPNNLPLPAGNLDHNVTHSSHHGFAIGASVNPGDSSQNINPNLNYHAGNNPVFKHITSYKNKMATYIRVTPGKTAYLEDFIIADNFKGDASTWRSDFNRFLWVGGSENAEPIPRMPRGAITVGAPNGFGHLHTIYDGPIWVKNSYFAGTEHPGISLFDQWGATLKYTGHTFENTTIASSSYNVRYRDWEPPIWANAIVYDVDGKLMGNPMTAIHQDLPILNTPQSQRISPGFSGMKSPHRYSYVEVYHQNIPSPQNGVLVRSDGATQTGGTQVIGGFGMEPILSDSFIYTLVYDKYLTNVVRLEHHSMSAGESSIIGIAGVPPTTKVISSSDNFFILAGPELPKLNSLAALKASTVSAWALVNQVAYIKYIAPAGKDYTKPGLVKRIRLCLTGDCNDQQVFPQTYGDCMTAKPEWRLNGGPWKQDLEVNSCEGGLLEFRMTGNTLKKVKVCGPHGKVFESQGPMAATVLEQSLSLKMQGNYSIYAEDQSGCVYAKNLRVKTTVVETCEANVDEEGWKTLLDCSLTVCEGAQVQLSINPNVRSVNWTGPGNFQATNTNVINLGTVTSAQAGTYVATMTHNSCTIAKEIELKVDEPPTLVAETKLNSAWWWNRLSEPKINTTVGDRLILRMLPWSNEVNWTGPGGNQWSGKSEILIEGINQAQAGTYTVNLMKGACQATHSVEVLVDTLNIEPMVMHNVNDQGWKRGTDILVKLGDKVEVGLDRDMNGTPDCREQEVSNPPINSPDLKRKVPKLTAKASSTVHGIFFQAGHAVDGKLNTNWTSRVRNQANQPEHIAVGFALEHVNYLNILPRYLNTSAGLQAFGFPVDFEIQVFKNGNWEVVKQVQNYTRPTGGWVTIPFDKVVATDSLRITATRLGPDTKAGKYIFGLAEMQLGFDYEIFKNQGQALEYGMIDPYDPRPAMPAGMPALMPEPLRDPQIMQGPDGYYYLTGTILGEKSRDFMTYNEGIKLWRSKDFKEWEELGLVWDLDNTQGWQSNYYLYPKNGGTPKVIPHNEYTKDLEQDYHIRRAVWAPEVHYVPSQNTWFLLACMNHNIGAGPRIGHNQHGGTFMLKSVSGKPEGPYVDVHPQGPLTGGIDANLFVDDDQTPYFVFGANSIAKLKADYSGLAEQPWNLNIQGFPQKGPVVKEGAFLFKRNGVYHLATSMFAFRSDSAVLQTYAGTQVRKGKWASYDAIVCSSSSLTGQFGPYYPAIQGGAHGNFFKDDQGKWWGTGFLPGMKTRLVRMKWRYGRIMVDQQGTVAANAHRRNQYKVTWLGNWARKSTDCSEILVRSYINYRMMGRYDYHFSDKHGNQASTPLTISTGRPVRAAVLLQGAWREDTMAQDLLPFLPSTQPYNQQPWTYAGDIRLTADKSEYVDWVLVQLRDRRRPARILSQTAALVDKNGLIWNAKGGRDLYMWGPTPDSAFVAVLHRNHLPVMTQSPVSLNQVPLVDFRNPLRACYGNQARRIKDGKAFMWAGDANADGVINAYDLNWGWRTNNGQTLPYHRMKADFNLDGVFNAIDKNRLWRPNNSKSTAVPK